DTGTCGGTTGTEDRYAIAVWQSEETYEACGSKLGFSFEAAKAFARIDFEDSDVNEGAFEYTSSLVDGWKSASAESNREERDCGPTKVGGRDGWKCTDTSGNYQVNLGGGSGCYLKSDTSKTPL